MPRGYTEQWIGRRFGRLVVVGVGEARPVLKGRTKRFYECKCDCGGTAFRNGGHLKQTVVGGCENCEYERRGLVHVKHGDARKAGETRLYTIWQGMKERCYKPKCKAYRIYGARGIVICQEWLDFKTFRSWATTHGYDDSLSIERINPRKNYEPANCEWIPFSENSKRVHRLRTKDETTEWLKSNWVKRRLNQKAKSSYVFGDAAADLLSFGG